MNKSLSGSQMKKILSLHLYVVGRKHKKFKLQFISLNSSLGCIPCNTNCYVSVCVRKETFNACYSYFLGYCLFHETKASFPYQFPVQIIIFSNIPPLIATLLAFRTRIKCLVGAAEAN